MTTASPPDPRPGARAGSGPASAAAGPGEELQRGGGGALPGAGERLLDLAAALVAVPSESRRERALADLVEARLGGRRELRVERVGDSVVARTDLGTGRRLVLAGHLDTVPPFDDRPPRVDGGVLWGLGAVDMKGGLAVLLDLAATATPAVDVTWVLYACEEVDRAENALGRLAVERPELLAGDAAVLLEPTGGVVEAGCQGTARAEVRLRGRRAHTARPWTGVNAVHRLGPVLDVLNRYRPRRVVLDGCEFAEQLQAVRVAGGVAGNVVPDDASVTVNFRFAPDRGEAEARAELHAMFGDVLGEEDELVVTDIAAGAPPGLGHPLLAALVAASGAPPRAKVGWTDVATFAAAGVPAANFGPGDPLLAHTPDEHVSVAELLAVRRALGRLVGEGPAAA